MKKYLLSLYDKGEKLFSLLIEGDPDVVLAFHSELFSKLFGMDGEKHCALTKAPQPLEDEHPNLYVDECYGQLADQMIRRYYTMRNFYYLVKIPHSEQNAAICCDTPNWLVTFCERHGAEVQALPLDWPAVEDLLDFDLTLKEDTEAFIEYIENGQQAGAKEAVASSQNSDSPKNVDPLDAMIHAHFDSLGELLKKFERKGALAMYAWIVEKSERDDYTVKDRKNLRLLAGQMLAIIEGRYGK